MCDRWGWWVVLGGVGWFCGLWFGVGFRWWVCCVGGACWFWVWDFVLLFLFVVCVLGWVGLMFCGFVRVGCFWFC